MKYPLQVYEVETELPQGGVDDAFSAALLEEFHRTYDARFGPGSGYTEAGAVISAVRVTVRGVEPLLPIAKAEYPSVAATVDHERPVYWRELGGAHRDTGLLGPAAQRRGRVLARAHHRRIPPHDHRRAPWASVAPR